MGTSTVRQAPRSDNWRSVVKDLETEVRKAAPIVDRTIKEALPTLPDGHVKTPVYYGVSEGVRFAVNVKKQGLEKALKIEGVRLVEGFTAPKISDAVWAKVAARVGPISHSPVGRIAENAFKRTLNEIVVKGAEAGLE